MVEEVTGADALADARALLARSSEPDPAVGAPTVDALARALEALVAHTESLERDRARLLQQQVALRTVISQVPFFVFWKDRDIVYQGCNDVFAALGGLGSPEEIVGKTDYDMPWTKEQSDLYREDDLRVMVTGKPILNIEETNLDANGSEKVILTSKVPLQDKDGTIIGMLGIFADITARKQMEKDLSRAKEQAETANRAKSDFLAAVGHELRTPLALILGPLDSLLERSDLPPGAGLEIERVRRNALRLKSLMDDVLDFAKADAGKAAPHDDVVDPEDLVRSLVDDVRLAATARGLEISADVEPAGLLTLDRRMFEKILLNLMGNALKFTPAGGRVVATLRVEGDALELAVRDTGIGIAESDLGRLFQRFQQVDSSLTRRYEGTGLGLALVKQFAELMGGSVGAESELGRGSRFFVRLPRRACASGAVTAAHPDRLRADLATLNARFAHGAMDRVETRATRVAGPDSPLVVLAEDNGDLRAYLGALLGTEYRVVACSNGADALAEATRCEPDVIVTDVMMPEMDGYELLSRVKAHPGLREVPVILLTALTNSDAVVTSLAGGAADFLNKPFRPSELLARVAVAARLRAAHKGLSERNRELVSAHAQIEASLRLLTENQAQLVEAERKTAVVRYEREMAIALQIQTSILPTRLDVPGFEIGASMSTASEVGGDYYDLLRTADGGFWLGIGDVSGHGLNAGLVMLMLQSGLATLMRQDPHADPASLLGLLNEMLYENVRVRLGRDDFATLSLFRFYPDGRFVVAGAHEDTLIRRARTARCEEMATIGAWVGALEHVEHHMRNQEGRVDPGDIVVLYTDGITEAKAPSREQFGLTRLAEALEGASAEAPQGICSRILDRVTAWSAQQDDDRTLVVIRRSAA